MGIANGTFSKLILNSNLLSKFSINNVVNISSKQNPYNNAIQSFDFNQCAFVKPLPLIFRFTKQCTGTDPDPYKLIFGVTKHCTGIEPDPHNAGYNASQPCVFNQCTFAKPLSFLFRFNKQCTGTDPDPYNADQDPDLMPNQSFVCNRCTTVTPLCFRFRVNKQFTVTDSDPQKTYPDTLANPSIVFNRYIMPNSKSTRFNKQHTVTDPDPYNTDPDALTNQSIVFNQHTMSKSLCLIFNIQGTGNDTEDPLGAVGPDQKNLKTQKTPKISKKLFLQLKTFQNNMYVPRQILNSVLSYNTLIPLKEQYKKQKNLATYIFMIETCALAFSDSDPQKQHLSMLYTVSDPVIAVGSDQKELRTQIKPKKSKASFLYLTTKPKNSTGNRNKPAFGHE